MVGQDDGNKESVEARLAKATKEADSQLKQQISPEALRDKEKAFKALETFLSQLQLQNELLESYLKKISKSKYEEVQREMEKRAKEPRKTSLSSMVDIRRRAHRIAAGERDQGHEPLEEEDLRDIASQMIESLHQDMEKLKEAYEQAIEHEQAQLDEVDMRIEEVKRETYEFKRDVIVAGENPRTGKIMAERVLRFLDASLAQKKMVMDKMVQRNKMLKHQAVKLEQQLKSKEDKGEMLNAIDFDQLKIENQQFLEKIDGRNRELLTLKLTTGRTIQVMNGLKSKLNKLMAQQDFLRKEIKDREEQSTRIDEDIDKVQALVEGVDRQLRLLKLEKDDPEAPQVMDFIKIKAEVAELERAVSDWERKCEIQTLEVGRLRMRERRTTRGTAMGDTGTLADMRMPSQGNMAASMKRE